jgi:hypothetical protein
MIFVFTPGNFLEITFLLRQAQHIACVSKVLVPSEHFLFENPGDIILDIGLLI